MINSHFLTAKTHDGVMDVFVSAPEVSGKCPVVIVLQEAFGVNHHIRSVCERLAREGFFAIAPELFHRIARRLEIDYSNRKEIMPILARMSNDDIVQDVQDAIEFLKGHASADLANVMVVGFCVGGFSSVLCATKLPLQKMVSFYGAGMVQSRPGIGLVPILNDFPKIKCPCLFFFGGQDVSIGAQELNVIENKLKVAHIPSQVHVYPNSDHGFFCDERKSYNQVDGLDAWKKTIDFLRS